MVHTSAIATGVAIIGMTNTVRSKPRNGNDRWNTSAAHTPENDGNERGKQREPERAPDRTR